MSLALPSAPERDAAARRDWRTIALVGVAHGTSHFFHLLLVPLFPLFAREFALGWAELGLLVTLFYAVSGVGQAASGFLVDRVGGRAVLWAALALFALAALAAALAQGYAGLMGAAALAGAGNAPFHPADFSILNRRVSPSRLGHAYAVHGVSGNLGWAATPLVLLALSDALGWRWAYAGLAAVALAVLALLVWQREALHVPPHPHASGGRASFAFLRLPAVWLAFSFFLCSTAAVSVIQGFAAPALASLHGTPPQQLALLVSAYMVCGALGMVLGGFWVAGSQAALERKIAVALAAAALLFLLALWPGLPVGAAAGLVAVAGLGTGLAGPSRDLLVKQAAPPGATGRVVGTVYSGLDVGFALGAPLAGLCLDGGAPRGVLGLAALWLLLALATAQAVAWATRRAAPQA